MLNFMIVAYRGFCVCKQIVKSVVMESFQVRFIQILIIYMNVEKRHVNLFPIMHHSAVSIPPPPEQPRGISSHCQSWRRGIRNPISAQGLSISVPHSDPQAFDAHGFKRWMNLSGRTKPL